jgi:hypothetical protein
VLRSEERKGFIELDQPKVGKERLGVTYSARSKEEGERKRAREGEREKEAKARRGTT